MKKLLLMLFALLCITGVAGAANIPSYVDAEGGPEVWITPVYNNSGSSMGAGSVVVWDVDASTGDNDNYVTTTTSADTYIVAGVVYPAAIAAGAVGSIAIRGPVTTNVLNCAVNGPVCSSAQAGYGNRCGAEAAMFGHCTVASASNSATVYISK